MCSSGKANQLSQKSTHHQASVSSFVRSLQIENQSKQKYYVQTIWMEESICSLLILIFLKFWLQHRHFLEIGE